MSLIDYSPSSIMLLEGIIAPTTRTIIKKVTEDKNWGIISKEYNYPPKYSIELFLPLFSFIEDITKICIALGFPGSKLDQNSNFDYSYVNDTVVRGLSSYKKYFEILPTIGLYILNFLKIIECYIFYDKKFYKQMCIRDRIKRK